MFLSAPVIWIFSIRLMREPKLPLGVCPNQPVFLLLMTPDSCQSLLENR